MAINWPIDGFQNTYLLLLGVSLFVESREQEVEENGMSSDEICKIDWIVAVIFE